MKVLLPAAKIYAGMSAVALFWILFQGRLSWGLLFDARVAGFPRVVLMALAAALFLIALSLYCNRNFLWAQQLEGEFSKLLVPMRMWEIAALGIVSGTAEEVFFRGALQPAVGLIPASLAFGLAHFIPRHPFWHWSLYATFAGFLLGCLFELTDHLLPVIAAHSLTNFVLILILNRRHAVEAAQ